MNTEDRFPHPLALLTAGILLAAALTWVLPAGRAPRQGNINKNQPTKQSKM